jgi:hypothetical protein
MGNGGHASSPPSRGQAFARPTSLGNARSSAARYALRRPAAGKVSAEEGQNLGIELVVEGHEIEAFGIATDSRNGACRFGRARRQECEVAGIAREPVVGARGKHLTDGRDVLRRYAATPALRAPQLHRDRHGLQVGWPEQEREPRIGEYGGLDARIVGDDLSRYLVLCEQLART